MNNEQEVAIQNIAILIEVEKRRSKYELNPPIAVHAIDFEGRVLNFDFDLRFDSLMPFSLRTPPITLHLRDAAGRIIEEQITDLSLESEEEEAVRAQNTEREI